MATSSGEPLGAPLPAPALRALDEEYEFLREIGRGGMAAVYLARARASGRVVAIKTVAAHRAHDPEAVARFEREARTMLALDHPNVVRSYSVEQLEDGALAIVMQHAAGGTLREALREALQTGDAFPPERVARILTDVAAALAHAHERGIVHRDVKPENIFLDPRNGRALLSDFGIARSLEGDNALTMTGSAIGTPTYMAPEQIDGRQVDGRSDVYALGLVGWEMLAGARPWDGDSLYSVIYKQRHETLAPLAELRPDAPEALRDAIERALRKDPAERWPDAAAFGDAVRATLPPAAVDDAAHVANAPLDDVGDDADAPTVVAPALDIGPVARDGGWTATEPPPRTAAEPLPRPTLRTRYGSARPAARLAVPLALALVAALAVRQGAKSRHARLAAAADSTVMDTAAADSSGTVASAAPTTVTLPAGGEVESPDTMRSAAPAATVRPAAGLARYARTHGDSLALCRSPVARDQRACFTATLADRDAPLNAIYTRLAVQLRRGAPAELARLRFEEVRWIAARDAACARAGRGREGSLWAASRAACLGDAADRRARELETRLARLRGR
ncbi:MAG TPA: protein kinase [Gemmatimonadaceae bacterium]|nr:protein kinase [Gemmatimonadaceae bacterium]